MTDFTVSEPEGLKTKKMIYWISGHLEVLLHFACA